MSGDILQKARDFEARYGPQIPDSRRPAFHAVPAVGWMNDPNGFSLYKGEYHLFYQYHPYSNEWGPMHWGHLKTRDFLHWERLPAALAPDRDYDSAGCFSGSAMEMPDGRQLLMYTGVERRPGADGLLRDVQTQCLAVGDGVNYEKWPGNPILDGRDLPEGGSTADFRDPKILRDADGNLCAVIGNRTADGSGAVLLYRLTEEYRGEFVRTLDQSHNRYGRMWECPDFFSLEGRQVLLVSPQDMLPMGLEFHAGNGALCLMGTYGAEKGFVRQSVQAIDYGLDFYAPQTLETPDGRRIMIAWMQNWDTVRAKPQDCRWFGQMTLPRELSLRHGRLVQNPVRELEACRDQGVIHRNVSVSGEMDLPGVRGRVLEMTVTVRPASPASYRWFSVRVAKDEEYETVLRYCPGRDILRLDRTRSGLPRDIVHTRTFPVRPRGGEIRLRIVLDRYSLEVFVNDGEQAASAVLYTRQEADGITFEAGGSALMDVEKYALLLDRRET